jgi:hypothetical protein
MKKKIPKRAKLIAAGGFYRFIPLESLVAQINVPVLRKISLTEPSIDYTETWHFTLVFSLQRVLKGYAEYRQVDCIKVESKS